MDGRSFWDAVQAHPLLEWLGVVEGETDADHQVVVRSHPEKSKYPLTFSLALSCLRDHSWSELLGVLLGFRQPRVMTHVTRIVGYYSFTYSWNKSKLAELRDRHKGNYGVPEAA